MKEFTLRLGEVPGSYYGFVAAVLTYVKKKDERFQIVSAFMDEHPESTTSDILSFISDQDDFYEDAAYAQEMAV